MRGGRRYFKFLYIASKVKAEGTIVKPFGIGIQTKESCIKTAEQEQQELIKFLNKRGLKGMYTVTLIIIKDLYELTHPKVHFDFPNTPEYKGRYVTKCEVKDGVQWYKWEPTERKENE